MILRFACLIVASLMLSACATDAREEIERTDPRIVETRVFIETVKPEVVNWVRYEDPLRYDVISNMHVILRTETGVYLMETEQLCRPLTQIDIAEDMRDRRNMRRRLRAGIDTLRGCTIETIYRLPGDPAETTADEPGQTNTQEPE